MYINPLGKVAPTSKGFWHFYDTPFFLSSSSSSSSSHNHNHRRQTLGDYFILPLFHFLPPSPLLTQPRLGQTFPNNFHMADLWPTFHPSLSFLIFVNLYSSTCTWGECKKKFWSRFNLKKKKKRLP